MDIFENQTYFETLDETLQYIRQLEESADTQFVLSTTFPRDEAEIKKRKIFFALKETQNSDGSIIADGTPFFIKNKVRLNCQHSKNKDKGGLSNSPGKERKKQQVRSVKENCPVLIIVRELSTFPTFKLKANTKHHRKLTSSKLRKLDEGSLEITESRFHVILKHRHEHIEDESLGRKRHFSRPPTNKDVRKFIKKLVKLGVVYFAELKRNTDLYISSELFAGKKPPSPFNRRFAVTRKDYARLVCEERDRLIKSRLDDDRVVEKVNSWQVLHCEDSFFLRLHASDVTVTPIEDHERFIVGGAGNQGFLFIYQSAWQKRLLMRYGGMCLLEAAYRTVKYLTPVFLLYVRTNAEYVVVATLVLQFEDDSTIAEALRILQGWNLEWKPWAFMVDYSNAEITAVKKVFSECEIYLSDFHREICWEEWISMSVASVASSRDELLARLQRCAQASAVYQFNIVKDELLTCSMWRDNLSLQKSFGLWLDEPQLWARAFRTARFHVLFNTNMGLQRLNTAMNRVRDQLGLCNEYSVSALLTFLVEKFIPDDHKEYIQSNLRYSGVNRIRSCKLPAYLADRPPDLVQHIYKRLIDNESIDDNGVLVLGTGTFSVVVPFAVIPHRVEFGDSANCEMPSCNCDEWEQYYWPCRHFCAIFQRLKLGWSNLAESYRDCLYFSIDEDVASEVDAVISTFGEINDLQHIGSHIEIGAGNTLQDFQLCPIMEQMESHEPYGIRCREIIRRIADFTYICTDASILRTLQNRLVETFKECVTMPCNGEQITASLDMDKSKCRQKRRTEGQCSVRKRERRVDIKGLDNLYAAAKASEANDRFV